MLTSRIPSSFLPLAILAGCPALASVTVQGPLSGHVIRPGDAFVFEAKAGDSKVDLDWVAVSGRGWAESSPGLVLAKGWTDPDRPQDPRIRILRLDARRAVRLGQEAKDSKGAPELVVKTLAGTADRSGSQDGPVSRALFHEPAGIAMTRAGAVLVTDRNGLREIKDGVVTTLVKAQPGASPAAAPLLQPGALALDEANRTLYVADLGCIRAVPMDGKGEGRVLVGMPGKPGHRDGGCDELRGTPSVGKAIKGETGAVSGAGWSWSDAGGRGAVPAIPLCRKVGPLNRAWSPFPSRQSASRSLKPAHYALQRIMSRFRRADGFQEPRVQHSTACRLLADLPNNLLGGLLRAWWKAMAAAADPRLPRPSPGP